MSTAFLIIDAQTGYARSQYHSLQRIQEMLPDIRAKMPVIWAYMAVNRGVRTTDSPPQKATPENYRDLFNFLGSNEPLLEPHESDWFCSKSKMNGFGNKHLGSFLEERGISEPLLGGYVDSQCITYSACGALGDGFNAKVMTDLVGRESQGASEKALHQYRKWGIPTGVSRDFF